MLNEPNIHSAAHVDASVAYRKWIESKGKEKAYELKVRELVERTKLDAQWDGVTVPTTLEEYCLASRQQQSLAKSRHDMEAAMLLEGDDDYCFCADDDDEEFDDFDEMYEEADDEEEVVDCEDEGVACHRGDATGSASKTDVVANSSVQPSGGHNVPSTSSPGG
ncbi:unnamed protein product [Mesocestoides corti]|nr:unnamed protein product [Mesocestoides corti]